MAIWQLCTLLAATLAAVSAESYGYDDPSPYPSYAPQDKYEDYPSYDRDYSFNYGVKDDYTYNYQTRDEVKKGNTVYGSYTVVEPDGKLRVVKYEADDYGFRATVDREGYPSAPAPYKAAPAYKAPPPSYPAYKAPPPSYSAPLYKPAPAYKPAPVYKAAPAPIYSQPKLQPAYKSPSYKSQSSYSPPAYKASYPADSYKSVGPYGSYGSAPHYKPAAYSYDDEY